MTSNHLDCVDSPGRHNEEERIIRLEDGDERIEMTPIVSVAEKHNNHHHINDYHVYYNSDDKVIVDGQVLALLHSPNKQAKNITTDYQLGGDTSERTTWSKKADFLLSIIGFAVDLANIWRFPYLCYKNGGGAFLIPYLIMLVFGALPLFYLELAVGQYNRQGPVTLWNICPIFKGIGYCAVLVSFYTSFYYNCIIGWAIYFLCVSVSPVLPWTHCENQWNTDKCREGSPETPSFVLNNTFSQNASDTLDFNQNFTMFRRKESLGTYKSAYSSGSNISSPAEEYFYRKVLGIRDANNFSNLGDPLWQTALCMLSAYVVLYFALIRGVKSSGKVVWITATMPYIVLVILFIRGTMLPGAIDGLEYFIKPNLTKLEEPEVWVDAAVQIFYSVGVGFGVHITYASYNQFNNNCYRDCLITSAINSITSLFSGMVIFTYLGFMSNKHQVDISEVATEGHGLVFQVYPEAIATLTGSQFWSVLFFFMLIMLGLDSSMGGLECVVTGIMDEYKLLFKKFKYSREVFTAVVFIISYMIALTNITEGGAYILHWFDTYAAGIALLSSAFFESVVLSWFYGSYTVSQDIKQMLGHQPCIFWRICWKFISPLFLLIIIITGVINGGTLSYNNYHYPPYAIRLGWIFTCSSIGMVPLYAIYYLFYHGRGSFKQRFGLGISPPKDRVLSEQTGFIHRLKLRHWLRV